jgi:acetate kinase
MVFTAGIGEHAPEIRSICARCAWLGIILDEHANGARHGDQRGARSPALEGQPRAHRFAER